jgi:uncharacterized protein with WD repeat
MSLHQIFDWKCIDILNNKMKIIEQLPEIFRKQNELTLDQVGKIIEESKEKETKERE